MGALVRIICVNRLETEHLVNIEKAHAPKNKNRLERSLKEEVKC